MKTTRLLNGTILVLFIFSWLSINAQTINVKGKVTDANNQPVASATISIKSKPQSGTVTNENGEFSISAAKGDVIEFFSVGFERKQIRIADQTILNISLNTDASNLDEVIVIGYGNTSKRNITTAVSKIDPKTVPQAANNSITQLLFGRAPGMQAVQNSSEPGGAISVSIRGRGNPLVVVDGVIMPFGGLEPGSGNRTMNANVNRGGFAGINPADVESIEFLKDASASIYGVNAENGVMIITTKKGKGGRINVSYDANRSIVKNMGYFEPLNATDYMKYYNQLTLDKYLIDNRMAPYGTVPVNLTPYYNSTTIRPYTDAQIASAGEGTPWLDYVLRDGALDNHNLSISGATERVNYYFSGGFFNQKGTIQNSDFKRYTGRMNLTYKLTNFFSLNTNINYGRNDYTNSQSGGQSGGVGQAGFGALQAAMAYPSTLPVKDPSTDRYTIFRTIGNPVSLLDIRDLTNNNSLLANFSADFTIIPKMLSAKLLYGNNTETAERNFFIPSTTFFDLLNRSRGALSTSKRENQTMEATLSFKKQFGSLFNLDAIAGIGEYQNSFFNFSASGADMQDGIGTDNLGSSSLSSQTVTSGRTQTKLRSYFTRASMNFLDRYLLTLSFRYDGFSQFFPQNKYAAFPSASLGWKITNEAFMKNVKFVNQLKLRASIGITGSAGSQAYGTFSPDNNVITFNNGGTAYVPYNLTQLDNPNLRWPKTVNKNLGLDFSLFKDKVSGSFDLFRDDLTDLITNVNTPLLSLIATTPVNSGHRVRQGWELGINANLIQKPDFQWSALVNVSRSILRWEERFQNTFLRGWQNQRDLVSSYYSYQTSGILGVGQTAPAWQPTAASVPGSPIFVDRNGDKKLDTNDIYRIDPNIDFSVGLGSTFRYKKLDFSIMFYGQFGGLGTSPAYAWANALDFLTGLQSGIRQLNEVFTTSNTSGTRPGVAYNQGALGLPVGTDIGLMSTDFVRCRNITLGYTFDQGNITKYVRNLRVFVDVQNPFIITKFKITDPEVSVASVIGGPAPYPMTRTFSLGFRANF